MLELRLLVQTETKIIYRYYPEMKEEYGEVEYNFISREYRILKLASNDSHKRYAFHAISRIDKYVEKDSFENYDIVAWG